jgi:hypothetical protein
MLISWLFILTLNEFGENCTNVLQAYFNQGLGNQTPECRTALGFETEPLIALACPVLDSLQQTVHKYWQNLAINPGFID